MHQHSAALPPPSLPPSLPPFLLQLLRQHREAGRRTIQNFLRQHKCYEVVRPSGKVVVFDTTIPFQLAFYALVEHGRERLWEGGQEGGEGRREGGVMEWNGEL